MLKHFYFSTSLFFVLIHINLLANTIPTPKKSKRIARNRASYKRYDNKRRKLNTTAPVQGASQPQTQSNPLQHSTQSNPLQDSIPSLCDSIERKKMFRESIKISYKNKKGRGYY